MPFKTSLEAAIAHLISKGTIKSNSDVARELGLKSRSTISSYASGAVKMSENFRTMFENNYKIKLSDFEHLVGEGEYEDEPLENSAKDYKDEMINLLKDQVNLLKDQVSLLKATSIEVIQSGIIKEIKDFSKKVEGAFAMLEDGQEERNEEIKKMLSEMLQALTQKSGSDVSSSDQNQISNRNQKKEGNFHTG